MNKKRKTEKLKTLVNLRDDIFDEIVAYLARFQLDDAERNRGLLGLARRWELEAEHFGLLLSRTGLKEERVSELKRVLGAGEICDHFLAEVAPLSWDAALEESRLAAPGALDLAVAKLLRAILARGDLWATSQSQGGWTLQRGDRGQLRFARDGCALELMMTVMPEAGAV